LKKAVDTKRAEDGSFVVEVVLTNPLEGI
jgi:hypothetical protein